MTPPTDPAPRCPHCLVSEPALLQRNADGGWFCTVCRTPFSDRVPTPPPDRN